VYAVNSLHELGKALPGLMEAWPVLKPERASTDERNAPCFAENKPMQVWETIDE
jgi:hypothetical protein